MSDWPYIQLLKSDTQETSLSFQFPLCFTPSLSLHSVGPDTCQGHPPPVDCLHFHIITSFSHHRFTSFPLFEPSKQNSFESNMVCFQWLPLHLKPNPSSSSWPGMCCVIQSLPNVPPSLCALFPPLTGQRGLLFVTREARLSPSSLPKPGKQLLSFSQLACCQL